MTDQTATDTAPAPTDSAQLEQILAAATEAAELFGGLRPGDRAGMLRAVADALDAAAGDLIPVAMAESHLPEARLQAELKRTTFQLRLFASELDDGGYLEATIDRADPDWGMGPRPDVRRYLIPLGAVEVYSASNFPFAFSVAGGDTASALAAGCPVIVKGHPGHPGTGEIVAEAIHAAINSTGVHPGVFSLVQSNTREAGEALVQHPLIKAIGFTGSLGGGRALFNLASRRPEPIPFFGELGSVNPMFLLPKAVAARGDALAASWAGSLTMGAGQFCTNPGVAIINDGADADIFQSAATKALGAITAQTMLSDGIVGAFRNGQCRVAGTNGVTELVGAGSEGRNAAPYLYAVSGETFLANPDLAHEVFGPFGILVRVKGDDEMLSVAHALEGQLTCTLHLDDGDTELAAKLMPVLERKAGRLLANGFPTGVEVADAMMHGGPYPASTNVSTTSVGTLAIRRFLRPVSYQNMPEALLPADLA